MLIILFAVLFLMNSCHSENDNEYFRDIDKEIVDTGNNYSKILAIYKRELKKYQQTHELKYLLCSKYVETSLYNNSDPKRISLAYELLRINNDENDYITIACNFFLAVKIEETSPKLSLQFLNEAIKMDEKKGNHFFLPRLYHAKAKWYYNHKNYSLAKLYYDKALADFKKNDNPIHISTAYSNFAIYENKMGNVDMAIKMTRYGIKILEGNGTKISQNKLFFINIMKGNLGVFFMEKKDYAMAEKYFNDQINFMIKTKEYQQIIVRNSEKLFELYAVTNHPEKEEKLIRLLIEIFPNLTNTRNKIVACSELRKYFAKKNDLKNATFYSNKLDELNEKNNAEISKELDNLSDVLNGYIIKNINQKYDFAIKDQQRKNMFLICFVLITIIIFVNVILKIRERNRKEKERLEQLNFLLESSKENLEKDIQLQKGKIKNLHMNLNLKIETEKAFLENLKKIKRSKNIDAEETVKDLFFKINNLLQIDEKNNDFISESSEENTAFMQKLSEAYPFLSKHDLKLCVYFRLSLSSKEISLLENITPGSVRVYKAKIKSKIGLGKDEELSSFLNTFK